MTDDVRGEAENAVLDNLRGTRDAMTVRGVYGEAYELDGVTIIPVARVSGGAGGGGGEGTGPDDAGGHGFGTGFGFGAQPVGVYEVRGGHVEWKPALDVVESSGQGHRSWPVSSRCASRWSC